MNMYTYTVRMDFKDGTIEDAFEKLRVDLADFFTVHSNARPFSLSHNINHVGPGIILTAVMLYEESSAANSIESTPYPVSPMAM